jgi:DNA-binding NtrC family response regulator
MSDSILVVDDEDIIRDSLVFVLKKEGFDVDGVKNGREAYERILQKSYDIVITDLEMPQMKGIELIDKITPLRPQTFIIIITAFASLETAIEALRKGAYDYIIKPIEFDDLLIRVRRLLEHKRMAMENQILRQEIHRQYSFHNLVGQSPSMKKVFETIRQVAMTDGTVLITGKSGTGKELVARAIHYNGSRSKQRFVPINCGAVVETLFESELFGHRRGAFTGATTDREGLFKIADKGTLFLDEVSEIPSHLQVKLLRAIEQKEVIPVGATTPEQINVRIISATNSDLGKKVEEGKFREDLYYRLNVVEIHLPPLSERREDIPLLVEHFVKKFAAQMNKNVSGVDNAVMQIFMSYPWKGEVRELENVVERAMIFSQGNVVTVRDLPEFLHPSDFLAASPSPATLKSVLHEFERSYIAAQLRAHGGNKHAAAKALGLNISSLYRKMEELGISLESIPSTPDSASG